MNARAKEATRLVIYDGMVTAIERCHRTDEVKDIRDKAMALEHYARQAHNIEAEKKAIEIRVRAERRAGQLLAEIDRLQAGKLPGGQDRNIDRASLNRAMHRPNGSGPTPARWTTRTLFYREKKLIWALKRAAELLGKALKKYDACVVYPTKGSVEARTTSSLAYATVWLIV